MSFSIPRFCRWRDQGIWEKVLEILVDSPNYEWLMIDASYIKVHPHATAGLFQSRDRIINLSSIY